MASRLANEVRATGTPIFCSACFNQDPSKQHVDFDAASDRGYGEVEDSTVKVALDDLILCEECLRRGAELIGMVPAEGESEIVNLRRQVDREKHRADELEKYAAALELAQDSRPNPIISPRRRGRPPKEDHAER